MPSSRSGFPKAAVESITPRSCCLTAKWPPGQVHFRPDPPLPPGSSSPHSSLLLEVCAYAPLHIQLGVHQLIPGDLFSNPKKTFDSLMAIPKTNKKTKTSCRAMTAPIVTLVKWHLRSCSSCYVQVLVVKMHGQLCGIRSHAIQEAILGFASQSLMDRINLTESRIT